MPVLEFGTIGIYVWSPDVCLIIFNTTSQVYNSWSLHDSNSTRTGACITQNQKDWRSRKLNHKPIGTDRPSTTFQFSKIYYFLKTITNVAAVVYRALDQRRLF